MKLLDIPNLKFLKVGVDSDPLNNNNLEYLEIEFLNILFFFEYNDFL